MGTILAIGGGGFQMEEGDSPIDDYLLTLAARSEPRICLLATPSGDREEIIAKFHKAFARRRCEKSHLAFFDWDPMPGAVALSSLRSHLLRQDIIFVSGGNTRAALAIWREWGVDQVLAEARGRDMLLAGMSAGAMCWFEAALTDTYWEPGSRPLPALGFLPGGCRVHYSNERDAQRQRLHAALSADASPATLAIDDGAAVLFRDGVLEKVLSWQPDATAYRVFKQNGHVVEHAYQAEWITAPAC